MVNILTSTVARTFLSSIDYVLADYRTAHMAHSHYKSGHTFKGLVGVAYSEMLTYVSELFTGNMSDREFPTERAVS